VDDTINGRFTGTDRFEVVRELGVGGMGVVYEVVDRQRNATVALKTLKASSGLQLFRFKQEFRALTELNHPNLIQLYELFAEGDLWYFTMEYVDGTSFMDYVCDSQALLTNSPTVEEVQLDTFDEFTASEFREDDNVIYHPSSRSVDLDRLRQSLKQLADGLNELHSRGMLHRDIKPANVMVADDGRVVLLDFGLVAELNASQSEDRSSDSDGAGKNVDVYVTVEQGIAGTVAYMAPEQGQGKALTPAGDWYAVGTMLYQALVGMIPFRGKFSQILRSKVKEDPVAPTVINSKVPKDLNDLCMGLLHRNPTERYSGSDILKQPGVAATLSDVTTNDSGIREQNAPFVGREKHLTTLHDSLTMASESSMVVVEVHGGSGMGKSTLIEHFIKSSQCQSETLVIQGRCYEQESVPYKAVDGLIDGLTRHLLTLSEEELNELIPQQIGRLARLFPVLKRVKAIARECSGADEKADPRQLRDSAIAALGRMIESISETKTLVLTIDDMQWGDVDSAILVNKLLRLGFSFRLLLIIGYRSEYVAKSPCLQTLHKVTWAAEESLIGSTIMDLSSLGLSVQDGHSTLEMALTRSPLERVDLPVLPLNSDSVRQLVDCLLPQECQVSEGVVAQIVKESDGNPFYVLELTRYVQSGRDFSTRSSEDLFLDEVVWGRVNDLRDSARQFLEVLSVAGQPISIGKAFRATGLNALDPRDLRVLQTGRLIRSTGSGVDDEVATFHDRIRENIVAHLSEEQLKHHHHALAEALSAEPVGDLEMIAKSFLVADKKAKACEFYIRAAYAAWDALAFLRAAELFRHSIALLEFAQDATRPAEQLHRERYELQEKLARALARAGLGSLAAEEYQIAARLTESREQLELEGLAAFHYATGGRIEEGSRLLNKAMTAVGLKLAQSPIMCLLNLVKERVVLLIRGLKFKKRAVDDVDADLLLQIDIAWRSSRALTLIDALSGFYMQARMLRLALKAGETERVVAALAWEGACISTSRFGFEVKRGKWLVSEAKRLADEAKTSYCLGMAALGEGAMSFCTGQFLDARSACMRADEFFREGCTAVTWERDSSQMFHNWSLLFLGELAELTAYAEAAVFDARERGDVYAAATNAVFSLAMARLACGDPEGAQVGIDENMANWPGSSYHVQHLLQSMSMSMIGIYQGQPKYTWARMEREYKPLKRSMLLEVRLLEIDYFSFKGRAALASLLHDPNSAEYRVSAEKSARRLEKTKTEWGIAQGHGIRAGLASIAGDEQKCVDYLRQAIAGYDKNHLDAFAAASRIRLGELFQGDEGTKLTRDGMQFLKTQQVVNIPGMVNVLSPGFKN
jgi:eukaryotic-like serine/threonine-protein kinase